VRRAKEQALRVLELQEQEAEEAVAKAADEAAAKAEREAAEAEREAAKAEEAADVLAKIASQQAETKANKVLSLASERKIQDDLESLHESTQLKLAERHAETKATGPAAKFASNL
jgi:colicin import membrane protein